MQVAYHTLNNVWHVRAAMFAGESDLSDDELEYLGDAVSVPQHISTRDYHAATAALGTHNDASSFSDTDQRRTRAAALPARAPRKRGGAIFRLNGERVDASTPPAPVERDNQADYYETRIRASFPPSMQMVSGETLESAARHFVEIERAKDALRESPVFAFIEIVHARSNAPLAKLIQDYGVIMDSPNYSSIMGEIAELFNTPEYEQSLLAPENVIGGAVPGAGGSGGGGGGGGGASTSGAATSGAGSGSVPPLVPVKKEKAKARKSFDIATLYENAMTQKQAAMQAAAAGGTPQQTFTDLTSVGLLAGAEMLQHAITEAFGSLRSMSLGELRNANLLGNLVSNYEQKRASHTVQRLARQTEGFERIVMTPLLSGTVELALRKLATRYGKLTFRSIAAMLPNHDVRADFGELVGLMLLEQAVLPNPRGNSYVVTQPRVIVQIQSVMRRFGNAVLDASGHVSYGDPRQQQTLYGSQSSPYGMFGNGSTSLLAPGAMGGMGLGSQMFMLTMPRIPR